MKRYRQHSGRKGYYKKSKLYVAKGKRYGNYAVKPSIQKTLNPFPPSMYVKLTYGINVVIGTNGSSALSVNYLHRLNSLYDPDQTGTGHQPYQFDQLSSLYERYQVYKASYQFRITDPSQDGLLVGACVRPASDTNSSMNAKTADYIVERRLAVLKPLNNTGRQYVSFRGSIPIYKPLGCTRAQFWGSEDGKYNADIGANPTDVLSLDAFVCDPNALVAQAYVRMIGTITFSAKLWEFLSPGQS